MCPSKKITNVVLNSNNALSGSVNNDANYFIDWNAILKPNTPYILHWNYVGQINTLTAASKLALVRVNFQMENYGNTSNVYGAPSTTTIGALRSFYLNGALNYLFADDSNNPPIYLENRPYSNTINVRIETNDAPPVLWKDNATVPVVNNAYTLILSFEEQ